MLLKIISVFIGGGIGTTLRFLASAVARKLMFSPIIATFCVNIIGCLLLGYITAYAIQKIEIFPQTIRLFITVGILGGLTTFSTLNLEVFELIKNGEVLSGVMYLIGSCIIGLLFTFLGYYIGLNLFNQI